MKNSMENMANHNLYRKMKCLKQADNSVLDMVTVKNAACNAEI